MEKKGKARSLSLIVGWLTFTVCKAFVSTLLFKLPASLLCTGGAGVLVRQKDTWA